MLEKSGADHEAMKNDLMIGKRFCHHAAERIAARLAGLFDNLDEEVLAVADRLLDLKKSE
jgi:hypothetical protein